MTDNEEAVAELLYTAWLGNGEKPNWKRLSRATKYRWMRVARITLNREVELLARFRVNARFTKLFGNHLVERLARWARG